MAFEGTGLIDSGPPESNYFSFLARKTNEGKIPSPSEMITGSSHTIVVDSRERDMKLFPNPAQYAIKFSDTYKNVTSVELKGSLIPKTEYNVNTGNMFIPFNITDSVTGATVSDRGYGYADGAYTFPTTSPAILGGTHAEVQVIVVNSRIESVTVTEPGTGYLRGFYGGGGSASQGFYSNSNGAEFNERALPRTGTRDFRIAKVQLSVGHVLVAQLTPGQYDFVHPNDSKPGLCREVTRSLQEATDNAIAQGIIVPSVGGPQTGPEYFPYSTNDGDNGSCYLTTTNPNASPNVQVCVQRGQNLTQSPFMELLWSDEEWSDTSAMTLLGYGSSILSARTRAMSEVTPLDQTNGTKSGDAWSVSPIVGRNNYDITNAPVYTVLSFSNYATDVDRIESTNPVLDKAFATLVFDANSPDVVFRSPTDPAPAPGKGPSDWSSLLTKPGVLKAIKGPDFDSKIIQYGPAPLSELSGVKICFRKYNGDLIDFHGRDHLLIFEIGAHDINSGNKW